MWHWRCIPQQMLHHQIQLLAWVTRRKFYERTIRYTFLNASEGHFQQHTLHYWCFQTRTPENVCRIASGHYTKVWRSHMANAAVDFPSQRRSQHQDMTKMSAAESLQSSTRRLACWEFSGNVPAVESIGLAWTLPTMSGATVVDICALTYCTAPPKMFRKMSGL